MSFDLGMFNQKRAYFIIDHLYKLGVRYFCLSPGSRSTSLAIALAEHTQARSFVHFDERGLGFHALGYAKSSRSPVALIVTSGTAVANLFPAVMEASLDGVPLVLLTADRPAELRECGANQTADQVKLFGSHTRWQIDLPVSDPLASDSYLSSSLSQAVYRAMNAPQGPVHINCMIREPFFSSRSVLKDSNLTPCQYEPRISFHPSSSFQKWAEQLMQSEKGIILIGSHATATHGESIFKLAEALGWPVFSDIISGARCAGNHPMHVAYYDLILKTTPEIEIDTILHFGDRIVSKTLSEWISKQPSISYFQVTDHPLRQDPLHRVNHRMECSPDLFCSSLLPFIAERPGSWALFWKSLSNGIGDILDGFFKNNQELTEPCIFQTLTKSSSEFSLFLSNSMPIRDADLFFFPGKRHGDVFANRGVSGIDGNIATAIGIACAQEKPLVAILGDLAVLHDINSFAQWKKCKTPVIFVVINNQGGGIFSFLPISSKKEIFEEFFATSHTFSFSAFAQAFSLPYHVVEEKENWDTLWTNIQREPLSCLIEIKTDRSDNVQHHQEIYQHIKKTLCSLTALSAPPTNHA
jgi:2-succinyl-5-enolpyruvyl-6-hydroxy-3-cyclohexene-1-carboxylate synthase